MSEWIGSDQIASHVHLLFYLLSRIVGDGLSMAIAPVKDATFNNTNNKGRWHNSFFFFDDDDDDDNVYMLYLILYWQRLDSNCLLLILLLSCCSCCCCSYRSYFCAVVLVLVLVLVLVHGNVWCIVNNNGMKIFVEVVRIV